MNIHNRNYRLKIPKWISKTLRNITETYTRFVQWFESHRYKPSTFKMLH